MRVQDGTGTTSFVLMEREVFKLIGKTAAEIRARQEKVGFSIHNSLKLQTN